MGAITVAGLALTILIISSASSSVTWLHDHAGSARWGSLLLMAILSALYALARPTPLRIPLLPAATASFLGVLTIVSALWSVQPKLTVERAVSFGAVLAVGGLLAAGSAGRARERERLIIGIAAGTALVALAGLVLLVVARNDAVVWWQPGSAPTRYRGFGENANTVALLASLSTPAAAWVGLEASTARLRRIGALLFLLVFGSVVASESRGAIVASGVALVFLTALLPRPVIDRLKLIVVVGVLLAVAVGVSSLRFVGNTQIQAFTPSASSTQPTSPSSTTHGPSAPTATTPSATPQSAKDTSEFPLLLTRPTNGATPIAIYPVSRSGELGHPFFTGTFGAVGAFTSSGRIAAWRGALKTAEERPLFGFGFGTEDRVFVDRYYIFQGARPENAYIGWLMQLGIAGLAAFVIFGLSLLWIVVRVVPTLAGQARSAPVALAAITLGGFLAALFQSYIYAAGNLAVLTFWVGALALATTTVRDGQEHHG